jgi:beta-xylosidase
MATPHWLAAAALAALVLQAPAWQADRGDGTYRNPILFADYSDPDAIRVGDDFYMISSSFTAVPGIPILHSRDLVNWTLIGHALPRLDDAFATPQHGGGVWAPALRHHDGRFWIYYPDPDRGIYLTTAAKAGGPWSTPVLVRGGKGLIDPCPLWDDDGRVYLVHAWARSRAGFANVLTLVELARDGTKAIDEGRIVIDGNALDGYSTLEGPKFYKRDGWYYIFAPAGGVKQGWQSVFRSRTLGGPYESRIVLAQGSSGINGPHQGALVDTPKGQSWFLHFQDLEAYGRVVHLQPVTWRDGWPVIGNDGVPVRAIRKPDLPAAPIDTPATTDEFNTNALGLQWQWQANPQPAWMSLTGRAIRLDALPFEKNLWMSPNLLLQKFPAPAFEATASLALEGLQVGDRTGLIVFGSDYAWVGVMRADEGLRVVMREAVAAAEGSEERDFGAATLEGTAVVLRATVSQGATVTFSYSTDNRTFVLVGKTFVAKPGKWVGAKVGLFAARPQGTGGHAEVDWFRIAPRE